MGEARYVLWVEKSRNHSKRLLSLCQEVYINKFLKHFQLHYSKLVDTPIEKGLTLGWDKCPKTNKEKESNVPLCKCNKKLNICHVVYTAWHLLYSWFCESLLEQPWSFSLTSCQENLSLPIWYKWPSPLLSKWGPLVKRLFGCQLERCPRWVLVNLGICINLRWGSHISVQ